MEFERTGAAGLLERGDPNVGRYSPLKNREKRFSQRFSGRGKFTTAEILIWSLEVVWKLQAVVWGTPMSGSVMIRRTVF